MAIRKTLTVKANGEEHHVKELTVKEIINFIDSGPGLPGGKDNKEDEAAIKGLFDEADEVLAIAIPGITVEALQEWAPSEIQKLYEAFREVNAVFFGVAQRLGLNNLMEQVERALARDFSDLFAKSLKQGITTP